MDWDCSNISVSGRNISINPTFKDSSDEMMESGGSHASATSQIETTTSVSVRSTKSTVMVAKEAKTREGEIHHHQSSSELGQSSSHGKIGEQKIDSSSTQVQVDFPIRDTRIENVDDVNQGFSHDPKGGLVPNFRVEGTGTGDSSITVAVASLASAVPLSNSSSCISRGDSTVGDEPCSGSGPISVQSSEEMKLSLVSWYSEPDTPSRIVGDSLTTSCCGEIATSLHLQNGRRGLVDIRLNERGSEEKENKIPDSQEQPKNRDTALEFLNKEEKTETENYKNNEIKPLPTSDKSQKMKMHVQLFEEKILETQGSQHACSRKQEGSCSSTTRNGRPECPRCSRRSKSGSATPASGMYQQSRSRTPVNRRVIQSSKSSTELKKPIKSILKSDSRGSGGSGSGSDNRSSMDSLGSTDICSTSLRQHASMMTRSDSGTRAKFNLNHQIYSDSSRYSAEDRVVSKLRRIEKYATLRLRKTSKIKPLNLNCSDLNGGDHSSDGGIKLGTPGKPNDLMTKSMSFLDKSTYPCGENGSIQHANSVSANSTLKRDGSLRMKKSSSLWEPCTTRTTALRLQKMHEAKQAKSGVGYFTRSGHSGSGDSIHHLFHSSTTSSNHNVVHSASSTKSHSTGIKEKVQHVGAKVFSKLSSAMGQTTSSNQKRLKQDKAVQTEIPKTAAHLQSADFIDLSTRTSLSPVPLVDSTKDLTDQIRQLERLAIRYRNTALRFQSEYEKSESCKSELSKQLQEAQTESNEMIEFLQAEKSTLSESLAEIENEGKKWRAQVEKESQSRCSSLVRLSEQHKQEALKSNLLMNRLEAHSNGIITQLSTQINEGTISINLIKQKVDDLSDSLLKTYKVPRELLASFADFNSETELGLKESDLSSSLLLPLISSLAAAFPLSTQENNPRNMFPHSKKAPIPSNSPTKPSAALKSRDTATQSKSNSSNLTISSSLQNLNQAILDREAAEELGLDDITLCQPNPLMKSYLEIDDPSLKQDIAELNLAIGKLLLVTRVIVIHCEKKVVTVASSILQCLKSMEDENIGSIPEIAQVQRSLEAWRDNSSTNATGAEHESSMNEKPL